MSAAESSPPATGRRVLVASLLLDPWMLFISRTLQRSGYEVTIATNLDPACGDFDNRDVLKWFRQTPFCRLISIDAPPESPATYDFAVLEIRGHDTAEERARVFAHAGVSPIRAILFRDYARSLPSMLKLLVKEILQPCLRRAPILILLESWPAVRWLRLLARPKFIGMVPHQRVMCQGMPEGLVTEGPRPYRINFMGAYGNEVRGPIVEQLEARWKIPPAGAHEVQTANGPMGVIWYADRPNSTRPRPVDDYMTSLTRSVFTLCFPGGMTLTHRAIEAIQCGSIPVLPAETAPHYALPLVHGRNCWLVQPGQWITEIEKLENLSEAQIQKMQAEIKDLEKTTLSIPALQRTLLKMLELER